MPTSYSICMRTSKLIQMIGTHQHLIVSLYIALEQPGGGGSL